MTEEDADEQSVIDAEQERCRAANAGEWEALESLLADELAFVHSVGQIDTKAQWVAELKRVPRHSFREGLVVQVLGEIAMTSGGMVHVFLDDAGAPSRVLPVFVLQVWVQRDGGWKLLAQQHTRVPIGR